MEEADGNTWEKTFDAANGFVYTLTSPFNMTTKLQESFRNLLVLESKSSNFLFL